MKKVDKQVVAVIYEEDLPVAVIINGKSHRKTIYTLAEAQEDEIIALIEDKGDDKPVPY